MKAEIVKGGFIQVTAENITEGFAMNKLLEDNGTPIPCDTCGGFKWPVIFVTHNDTIITIKN